jgi:hypothetical protein
MTFVEQRDVLCAFVYALTGALHPEQRRVLRNNLLTAAEAFAAGSGRTPELLRLCAASVESAAPPTFGH